MKYSNILKIAIAALLPALTGCSDSIIESLVSPYNASDSDTVHVTFALDFDEADGTGTVSRADTEVADDSNSESNNEQSEFAKQIAEYNLKYETETQSYYDPTKYPIYIVAFDENHLLTDFYTCEYKKSAYPKNEEGVQTCNYQHHYFDVVLNKSDKPRYFHIIANHEIDSSLPFATESDIFNSDIMTTTRNVYWRRIYLEKVDDDVVKQLSGVKLIRNFARVMLDFSVLPTTTVIGDSKSYGSDYFTDVEWCMMNIPTASFVAPYMKGQQFATYLNNSQGGSDHNNSTPYTYNELYDEGYRCHVPRTQNNINTFYKRTTNDDADNTKEETAIDKSLPYDDNVWRQWYEPLYVFENEGASDTQNFKRTTFLIRAKTKTGETWYYRMNLVDATRNFEQLYLMRNVTYKVQITSITDAGFGSASEAFIKAASNNFSGSTSTSSFTNVSINNASLRVEYMTKYVFSDADVTMKYRYVPDVTYINMDDGTYVSENDKVKVTSADAYTGTQVPAFEGTRDDGFAIASHEIATSNIDGTNYRLITFKPNKPQTGDVSTTSKIRVQVNDPQRTQNNVLYRDVTFILRNRYLLKNINISKDATNTYTLTAEVPDNLPKEIFPLDFTFETYPPTTYPNAEKSIMRVISTDESLFTSGTKDSFHFHRAVTWEKYTSSEFKTVDGYKQITFFFHFLTENLPEETDYVFFAVYEPSLSPDPDVQIDYQTASPLYASYKFTTSKDDTGKVTDVDLEKKGEYKTNAEAKAAWDELKALKTGSSATTTSLRRRSSAKVKDFDPVVGAKNPQRIARLRAAMRR